jgi:SAM-dependent methyltransferase
MVPIDDAKLQTLLDKMIGDIGATATAALVLIGDKLGLYRAMVGTGPVSSAELAQCTGTTERYVREWLAAQAAAGYVEYDAATGRFALTPEQAMVLADEDSPTFAVGAFPILASLFKDEPTITEAFQTGRGVDWREHSPCLFRGLERFSRTACAASLVQEWIPALNGVREKLERGARVADVECGHGASTIVMAQAFPRSRFRGFDGHAASIARAREAAREAGVTDAAAFEIASPATYAGEGYDLVTCFSCLHDFGDPVGVAARVRSSLAVDGTWLIVEPFAHDGLAENLTPVGRFYYAISTMVCTPASLNEGIDDPLGAQAGEARLRAVVTAGGFSRFRRVAETLFNLVFEARP